MNNPLESYLDRVHRALWCVPARWRAEQIAEVCQHLTDRADELTITGLTPAEAEEEAVRRFGTARETSRRLIVAWWRQLLPLDKASLHAALITCGGTLSTVAVTWGVVLADPFIRRWLGITINDFFMSFTSCLLWCFLSGLIAGRSAGCRAAIGAVWGGLAALGAFSLYAQIRTAQMLSDPEVRQQIAHWKALAAQGKAQVYHVPISLLTWQIALLAVLWMGACIGMKAQQRTRQRVVA